jgi:hypothetical protein
MCLRAWMKGQVIVLSKDYQFALPVHAVGSPGGILTNTAVSFDTTVSMTEIEL